MFSKFLTSIQQCHYDFSNSIWFQLFTSQSSGSQIILYYILFYNKLGLKNSEEKKNFIKKNINFCSKHSSCTEKLQTFESNMEFLRNPNIFCNITLKFLENIYSSFKFSNRNPYLLSDFAANSFCNILLNLFPKIYVLVVIITI